MKKLLVLLLTLVLGLSLLPMTASAAVDWENPPFGEYITPDMYPNTDFSQPYEVQLYTMSAASDDEDMVLAEMNKLLADRGFNTSIKLTHIVSGAGSGTNMYALSLASGERIDVILTAPWRYMWSENAKGSFSVLNEEPDWIEKYMPITSKYQDPASWAEVTADGKIIAVPGNVLNPNAKYVMIRQDLAEKHGITELKTWDDYKNYVKTIAAEETASTGIFGMNASTNNRELWRAFIQQENRYPLYGEIFHYVYDGSGNLPDFSEVSSYFETDLFRRFCHDMKELADAGVWSQSAQTNTVSMHDSFANLTGASMWWNGSVYGYGRRAEQADSSVKAVAYDIFSDAMLVPEAYSNNNYAIPVSTGNKERAAFIIDMFKNDFQYYSLVAYGIEGHHYQDNGDNTYTRLIRDTYSFGDLAWAQKPSWGPQYMEELTDDLARANYAMTESQRPRVVTNPTVTFIFNDEAVKNEVAAMNALADEYLPMLELGMAPDVDVAVDEFITKLNSSGLPAIYAELERQYDEWKATRVDAPAEEPADDGGEEAPADDTGTDEPAPATEAPAEATATPAPTEEASSNNTMVIVIVIIAVVVVAAIVIIVVMRRKKSS